MNWIFGRHPVAELLRARPQEVQHIYFCQEGFQDIAALAAAANIPVSHISKQQLTQRVGDVTHQGVVASVRPFHYADLAEILKTPQKPLILALDQIQDPHNLGALIRSACALGAHGVVIPKDRACEVTPVVMKSAAGATAHIPIVQVTNLRRALDTFKDQGIWIVGAAAGSGKPLSEVDFSLPTVIVTGNEGSGLRRLVAEACDVMAHIPMGGTLDSLNASVAGSLFLYEAARQRFFS